MPDFGSGLLTFLLIFGSFIVLMYFLSVRPMQRKMREQQAMISEIQPGTRVMLTSGIFGTVQYLGETQAVIELAPGQEITILKGAIKEIVNPDAEEFVFDDSSDSAETSTQPLTTTAETKLDFVNPDSDNSDQA